MASIGAQRRHERERALELMYEASIKSRSITEILDALILPPPAYTLELLASVGRDGEWAREQISSHAVGWSWERMALIDRLVMTLALCELRRSDAPPRAVVLDEAVEMARRYSTEQSANFVNGVLAGCLESLDEAVG